MQAGGEAETRVPAWTHTELPGHLGQISRVTVPAVTRWRPSPDLRGAGGQRAGAPCRSTSSAPARPLPPAFFVPNQPRPRPCPCPAHVAAHLTWGPVGQSRHLPRCLKPPVCFPSWAPRSPHIHAGRPNTHTAPSHGLPRWPAPSVMLSPWPRTCHDLGPQVLQAHPVAHPAPTGHGSP